MDAPKIPKKKKVRIKGKTSKALKENLRIIKAAEESPFARECIDFLLRYQGDDPLLDKWATHAMRQADWVPDHETVIAINLAVIAEQRALRQRLMFKSEAHLPDALAD